MVKTIDAENQLSFSAKDDDYDLFVSEEPDIQEENAHEYLHIHIMDIGDQHFHHHLPTFHIYSQTVALNSGESQQLQQILNQENFYHQKYTDKEVPANFENHYVDPMTCWRLDSMHL